MRPGTKIYLRELVVWGLAAFCLLTTFVVMSQGGFGFLRDSQDWNRVRVAAFVATAVLASAVVIIVALWSERPHRRSQD